MVKVNDTDFESEVLNAEIPVLVDFYADWCGPCRMIEPAVEEISNEYAGKLKVCRLDVDKAGMTAAKYGITSIPFLGFFKNGKLAGSVIGAVPKAVITQKVEEII